MRILFTGGSSFTGYWFIKALAAAGHQVVATFQKELGGYSGARRLRVDELMNICTPIFNCSFGTEAFIELIQTQGHWDVLCHHAADVTNYKSPDFDVAKAVHNNTLNLKGVLEALETWKCKKIVLTGSVFEQNEGAGPELWRAFSPYGLSKGFTADIFRHFADARGMKLGKFVIPNPFGPLEDPRFTTHLVQNWAEGKTPAVNTPNYVRDNIHVTLLAKVYARFVEGISADGPGFQKCNPSGYVESQGAFAKRFAAEIGRRLGISCDIDIREQTNFSEPLMRVNTDSAAIMRLHWNEGAAWDELAHYYQVAFRGLEACK